MAFQYRLDRRAQTERDRLVEAIELAHGDLLAAIRDANDQLAELREKIEERVTTYNAAVEAAAEWTGEIAAAAQDDWNDRSEKWQESDRGQAAHAWLEHYDQAELDTLDIELPDDIEEPDTIHAGVLSELPESAT